jgi:heterodisulfide reductase subunit B
MKQPDIERHYGIKHAMPIYYLTDLVGQALGFQPEALGVNRHFVGKA